MLPSQIVGRSDAAVKSVVPARPDVLRQMPSSCNRVFDLLMLNVHGGKFVTSLRELASAARLSPSQVHRALRRLEGAHLIRWERGPGRGHRSQITLLWASPKATQSSQPEVIHSPAKPTEAMGGIERENRNVSPYARDTLCPRETKTSHTGKTASALPLGPRALAWAMAQIRNDLRARPSVDPGRRAAILGALGAALHRAVGRGKVRTKSELSCLVGFILARLEERRGLGLDLGATRRWAEWCVREGLRRVEEERAAQEKAARFLAELRREVEEARRAWAAVSREGSTLAFYPALPSKPLATAPNAKREKADVVVLFGTERRLGQGRLSVPGGAEEDRTWLARTALLRVVNRALRDKSERLGSVSERHSLGGEVSGPGTKPSSEKVGEGGLLQGFPERPLQAVPEGRGGAVLFRLREAPAPSLPGQG
ncbi:MAG: SgrR family transcriptional regulator [Candidatus Hadarchaeum sp.]